jgi:hypothetical protein
MFSFRLEDQELKFPRRIQVTMVSSVLIFFSSTSCRPHKVGAEIKEATAASSQQLLHTPPFDFSIKFDAVSKEIAEDFKTSYKNPNSFTGSLKITDFVSEDLQPNKVGEKNPQSFLNPATKEAVLRKAVSSYIAAANTWIKLQCLNLDDTEARKKPPKFRFTGPRQKFISPREAASYGIDPSSLATLSRGQLDDKLTASKTNPGSFCSFNWAPTPLAKGESLPADVLMKQETPLVLAPFDETGRIYRWHQFSAQPIGQNFFEPGGTKILRIGTILGVKAPNGQHFSGSAGGPPLGANLYVSGDYLFSNATHTISKSYVNPVMKFDPKTGKPLAFYDYSMLFIESLDDNQEITLTTVLSSSLADIVKNPATRGSVGTLYPLIPSKVDQFVSWREVPASTPYWFYERLPVGSQQFMANAIWSDPPGEPFGAQIVIPKIKKAELKRLVLSENAFLNPYDHLREKDSGLNAMTILNRFKGPGDCVPTAEFVDKDFNIPASQPVSHELILGGKTGREFWQKRPNSLLIQEDGRGNYCAVAM